MPTTDYPKYHSDGTGRDGYIVMNNGGLISPLAERIPSRIDTFQNGHLRHSKQLPTSRQAGDRGLLKNQWVSTTMESYAWPNGKLTKWDKFDHYSAYFSDWFVQQQPQQSSQTPSSTNNKKNRLLSRSTPLTSRAALPSISNKNRTNGNRSGIVSGSSGDYISRSPLVEQSHQQQQQQPFLANHPPISARHYYPTAYDL